MPLIHVDCVAGRLTPAKKAQLGDLLIKAVMEAEGIADTPESRMVAWCFFHERAAHDWIAPEGQDARYLVRLVVPKGLLDEKGKALAVQRVTEAVQAIEGPDTFIALMGPWVLVEEIPDGNWGAAGIILQHGSVNRLLHAS